MSYPFIIWTMQRTGGTSLANLLMLASEHPKAEHEPFNWRRSKPREFGSVAQAWARHRDENDVNKGLADIFARRYLIKHCYELPEHSARHKGAPFNVRLLRAVAKTDYRHILLRRRDEQSRLVSRFIAEANGTWFDDYASKVYNEVANRKRELPPLPVEPLVKHYEHCRSVTRQLQAQAQRFGINFHEVIYEDIYHGERAARMARLQALVEFLGFPPLVTEWHRDDIEDKIFRRRFDTGQIAPLVPNIAAVTAALASAGYRGADAKPDETADSWLASLGRKVSALARFRR